MSGSIVRRVARFGAAAGVVAVGFLGLGQAAQAQTVNPYPTVTTAPATTTTTVAATSTTQGTNVHASDTSNATTVPVQSLTLAARPGSPRRRRRVRLGCSSPHRPVLIASRPRVAQI
jgi:hypothetical protein